MRKSSRGIFVVPFQFHSVPKQTKMASGLTMFRDENWMRLFIEVNVPFG